MSGRRSALLLLALMLVCVAPSSFAHPMGNFSVNHYSKISLESDGITIRYIIDLAEIPTYQELQEGNVAADADAAAVAVFLSVRGEVLKRGLILTIDGKPVPLRLVSKEVIFPPGAGGLPTMKMGFVYRAAYPDGLAPASSTLEYSDKNFEGHAGWKEVVVPASAGYLIRSSVPQTNRSAELTNYPTDLLNSPPQDLQASVQFRYPAAASAASAPLSHTAIQVAGTASALKNPARHPHRTSSPRQLYPGTIQARTSAAGVVHELPSATAGSLAS